MALDEAFLEKIKTKRHKEIIELLQELIEKVNTTPTVDTSGIAAVISQLNASDTISPSIEAMTRVLSKKIENIKLEVPEKPQAKKMTIVRDQQGKIKHINISY